MPILLCFSFGILIGAVSPGVLVPSCMKLYNEGYGVNKKIPTTLIAAASFSDIIAIELYGLFTELEINDVGEKTHSIEGNLLNNFLQIFGGIVCGLIAGAIVGISLKKLKNWMLLKLFAILVCLAVFVTIVEITHYHESLFAGTL